MALQESFSVRLGKQRAAHRARLPKKREHGEPEHSWSDNLVLVGLLDLQVRVQEAEET